MLKKIILGIAVLCVLIGCLKKPAQSNALPTEDKPLAEVSTKPTLQTIEEQYKDKIPKEWGEKVTDVLTCLPVKEKIVFLTFDACGSTKGMGCDRKLLAYLQQEKVPATLFINSRWIAGNTELFKELAQNPLFSLQNHGTEHRPLCVNGRSVYGIKGTDSVSAVYKEIMGNDRKMQAITGEKPVLFRSGTAYYDEVAVQIAKDLGYTICGFDILGDAGATFSCGQIIKQCQKVKPGSIIIFHMNHPESATREGVKVIIPMLRKKGYRFGKIVDYQNQNP